MEKAETDKAFEDYQSGIRALNEAIKFLERHLEDYNKQIELSDKHVKEYRIRDRNEIAEQIANYYGMMGGQFRRDGEIENAIAAYDKGLKYEANPLYQISNSYCLTNSIILRIIQRGKIDNEISRKIQDALSIINEQVLGIRKDDWWARADLGLLYLLNNDQKNSEQSYEKFGQKGASPLDYKSVISVLNVISLSLNKNNPKESQLIDSAVNKLSKKI
jgi:tetratricopeptide (TPR) repeat protein